MQNMTCLKQNVLYDQNVILDKMCYLKQNVFYDQNMVLRIHCTWSYSIDLKMHCT